MNFILKFNNSYRHYCINNIISDKLLFYLCSRVRINSHFKYFYYYKAELIPTYDILIIKYAYSELKKNFIIKRFDYFMKFH